MKYLVMDTKYSYAILLDEMGHMVYAANRGYEIGQQVEDPQIIKTPIKRPLIKYITVSGTLLAMASVFILYFGINRTAAPSLYARIYLSINPDVVMSVDHSGEVFELEGIDEDGKILIENYDFKGKDEVEVTKDLINKAKDESFLKEGMTITIEIDNKEALKDFGPELRKEATKDLDIEVDLKIATKGAFENSEPTMAPNEEKPPKEEKPSEEETPVQESKPETSNTPTQKPAATNDNKPSSTTKPNSGETNAPIVQESNYQNSNYGDDQNSNYSDQNSNYQSSGYESDQESDYDD